MMNYDISNTKIMTAKELQELFEALCAMEEDEFQEIWRNSEIFAKLNKYLGK